MLRYDNQVVLITGAAGAIGKQLALQFAQRGASLALIDLEDEPLQHLIAELKQTNTKHAHAACDITHREAMHAAVKQLETNLGPIDVVIANAGIALNNPIKGFDATIFNKQVTVNLIGTANTLEPIIPGFIKRRRTESIEL